jgi:GrpB-like predicted nucleotidyltransferase (UPF0157 family)
MRVRVVPPDPTWKARFAAEADLIRSALGDFPATIHHIGSTAIPGIYAKPVIDILLEVADVTALDTRATGLIELGYEAMGEYGIPGRRYFRKNSTAGVRTFLIHAFERDRNGHERHLAFRDYMIAHPSLARTYSDLKRKLADAHPDDIEGYMDGKDAFIKEHEALAIRWKKTMTAGHS